jgi:uncharacterized protein YegP (UPF0339 family)
MSKFQIYQDKSKEKLYRFRLVAGNNEIFHSSARGYDDHEAVENRLVETRDLLADIDPSFYVDPHGEHRWLLEHPVGPICHEGFTSKQGAEKNHGLVCEAFASLSLETIEEIE